MQITRYSFQPHGDARGQLIALEEKIDFLTRNKEMMATNMSQDIPSETVRMAMVMVAVLPIACSYPFFQKYFVSGLTIGAVKG